MSEQLSSKQLCNILTHFDKIYDKMPDIEKKRFMRDFVESIELFPECQENGSLLKHIDFKFPVSYNVEDASIVLPTGNDVETVVRFSPSSEIWVEQSLSGTSLPTLRFFDREAFRVGNFSGLSISVHSCAVCVSVRVFVISDKL